MSASAGSDSTGKKSKKSKSSKTKAKARSGFGSGFGSGSGFGRRAACKLNLCYAANVKNRRNFMQSKGRRMEAKQVVSSNAKKMDKLDEMNLGQAQVLTAEEEFQF